MEPDVQRSWDILAIIATLITFGMSILYVVLITGQGDRPAAWFLFPLALAGLLAAYAASRTAPRRIPALVGSGVVLVLLGALGILTIGLPILIAGVLALISAIRSGREDRTARAAASAPR